MTSDERGTAAASSVLQTMKESGWAARLSQAERRFDLWSELEERIVRGELDDSFADQRVRLFGKPTADAPNWARSILLVAIPDPAMKIRFGWLGREVAVTVPPTFLHAENAGEPRVQALLEESMGIGAVRAETASVPKKLLAARSGLARYGRNNVTYIEGLGSYYRLSALYTDIPCDTDTWRRSEMLDSCESCGACIRACPTGAIDPERFLVHAERCITYWQEKPGDVPYPDGLDFSWQDQFIGCMRCQAACPHNQGLLKVEEAAPPFAEEETAKFLRGVTIDDLAPETIEKLKRHDILDYLEVLPRNLPASLRNATRDVA
jgi:epoxyqueuosine reductase